MGYIILFAIIVFLIFEVKKAKKGSYSPPSYKTPKQEYTYQPREIKPYELNDQILTYKEKAFYKSAKPIADKYDLIIFCKMRIADIVSVSKQVKNFWEWFNKISMKHIDFVICNQDLSPIVLIEIDDYTHDRKDRVKRDKFVDRLFESVNLRLVHLRVWEAEQIEIIFKKAISDKPRNG